MTDNDTQDPDPADRGKAYLTALAVANGQDPPSSDEIDPETATAVANQLGGSPGTNGGQQPQRTATDTSAAINANHGHGALGSPGGQRTGTGSPGYQYDTERDTWDVLGYPESDDVDAEDYITRVRRQDPAHVIATKPVQAAWKLDPVPVDGKHDIESEDDTQFEQDMNTLIEAENDLIRGLLHYLEWADREQRPGQYGLLFLGFDDGREKSEPVDVNQLSGPEDLKYLRPFNQAAVESWTLAGDLTEEEQREHMPPTSDEGGEDGEAFLRPDMPVEYEVNFTGIEADGSTNDGDTEEIHWTRVIHIVETPTESEFIGMSCLEPILNRLMDFEKVLGASAEMYWTGADRKYFLSASGGQDMVDDEDIQWLDHQFEMMAHNMRQAIYTQNMDFERIDGQAVDPSGIIDSLYQSMAGVSGLPQRIMTGSERGDLASSMDQATWFGRIHERQQQFCEPSILRPVIDRLINYGVVAPPSGELYTIEWPSLFELTDIEKANMGLTIAQTFHELENAIALGAPRELAYDEAGYQIPEEEIAELEERDEEMLDAKIDDGSGESGDSGVEGGTGSSGPGTGTSTEEPEDGADETESPAGGEGEGAEGNHQPDIQRRLAARPRGEIPDGWSSADAMARMPISQRTPTTPNESAGDVDDQDQEQPSDD